MTVTRYDVAELGSIETTPQGFLRAPAFLTRAGVLDYRRPDGSVRRELRPPSAVFDAQSLATLAAAPLTDLHPAEMVSPKNFRKLAIGHVSEDVKRDGQHVAARVTVQDADAIAAVQAGERRELSCGYTCDLDETPGTHNGEHYDAVQRNIRYNHVGIGPKNWGRAGNSVALRLDADDPNDAPEVMRLDAADAVAQSRLTAPTAIDTPAPDATDDELDQVQAERDYLRTAVAALEQQLELASETELDQVQAERDALRAKADLLSAELERSRTDAADRFDEHVHSRAALLAEARRWLDAEDSKQLDRTWSERRIQERVLERYQNRLDGRRLDVSRESTEFVRSRYEACVARLDADAKRARQSTPVFAHDQDPENIDVHAVLDGRVQVAQPPRKYVTPPWRQPLSASRTR